MNFVSEYFFVINDFNSSNRQGTKVAFTLGVFHECDERQRHDEANEWTVTHNPPIVNLPCKKNGMTMNSILNDPRLASSI